MSFCTDYRNASMLLALHLWYKELDKVMTAIKFLHCGIYRGRSPDFTPICALPQVLSLILPAFLERHSVDQVLDRSILCVKWFWYL